MKKIIFGIMLLVALGFAFGTQAANAAGTEVLTPANASILKQSLDVVDAFVGQLETRVSAKDPAVLNAAPQVNAVLESVSANLRGINSTLAALDANEKALARNQSGAPIASTPAQVVAEATQAQGISPISEIPPVSTAQAGPEVAVIATHFNIKSLVWPAVAILVIFAAVWSLRARKGRHDKETLELGANQAWDAAI
jgi:hypothetical protein